MSFASNCMEKKWPYLVSPCVFRPNVMLHQIPGWKHICAGGEGVSRCFMFTLPQPPAGLQRNQRIFPCQFLQGPLAPTTLAWFFSIFSEERTTWGRNRPNRCALPGLLSTLPVWDSGGCLFIQTNSDMRTFTSILRSNGEARLLIKSILTSASWMRSGFRNTSDIQKTRLSGVTDDFPTWWEDLEQVVVALKLRSHILIQPVVQPASQSAISSGRKLGKHFHQWKMIKGKGGSEETSRGASLMIKEAHVSEDVSLLGWWFGPNFCIFYTICRIFTGSLII